MFYWIAYYVKRFWYILAFIVVMLFLVFILYINKGELISHFDPFNNKVSYEPEKYTETEITEEQYLSLLEVGAVYIGDSAMYVPTYITESGQEEEYLEGLKKDPYLMYKKNISWAKGNVTNDEYLDLIELIGYHLNKNDSTTAKVVNVPSNELLEEYGEEVVYYTDDKGTLYLNVHVIEVAQNPSTQKSYFYTFRLSYDMEGRVNIR